MTGTEWKDRDSADEAAAKPAGAEGEAAAAAAAAVQVEAPVEAASAAERLAAAEAEVARLKNEYLRALAEMENVRKRAARDRQEAGHYAIAGFARDLLSVADNLQRALASVDPQAQAADPALQALTSGVEMTEKELLTVLERHGVKPIAAMGQPFDPHVHEALYELPDPTVPHGTVVQVAQTGYMLHDRTLRPARVGLARGGPKPGAAPIATAGAASDEDDVVVRFPGSGSERPADDDSYRRDENPGSRFDETH